MKIEVDLSVRTWTFKANDGWYIDITLDDETGIAASWLWHESCGIKSHMFDARTNIKNMIKTVEENLKNYEDKYVEYYF